MTERDPSVFIPTRWHTVGSAPAENRFTVSRTGGKGVQCCGFRDRTGNSDSIGLVLWGGGGIAVQRPGRAEATLPEARRDDTLPSPQRLDLASLGLIPTLCLGCWKTPKGISLNFCLPLGLVLARE